MRRSRRGLHLILALALIAAAAPAAPAAPASPERAAEASIRQLRRAVVPRPDGSHLLLLSSLRQLNDPSLRSFFYQLSQHGDPKVRIHAILGLARIGESGKVDPWLITRLENPDDQFAVITSGLELGLIDTPQIKKLLEWHDLASRGRVMLLAELLARGEPADRNALTSLAEDPRPDISGLAAGVLAQLGDDTAFASHRAVVEAMTEAERRRHLRTLYRLIATFKLTNLVEWVVESLHAYDLDPEIEDRGIMTVLVLDPQRGAAVWAEALGGEPDQGTCVRHALLLLEAGPTVPSSAYDRLPRGDLLVDSMAQAGRAVSQGPDAAEALIELLALGHFRTTHWAVSAAGDLPDEQAARVYGHLLDGFDDDARGQTMRAELAMIAAGRLFEIDPEAVVERLLEAKDDGPTQEAILLGLLGSDSPAAGEAARRVKHVGFGHNDSLALILIAKHAVSPTPEELEQLGVIASGGGRVSDVLRTQAAWLYLKHTSKIEQALLGTFVEAEAD